MIGGPCVVRVQLGWRRATCGSGTVRSESGATRKNARAYVFARCPQIQYFLRALWAEDFSSSSGISSCAGSQNDDSRVSPGEEPSAPRRVRMHLSVAQVAIAALASSLLCCTVDAEDLSGRSAPQSSTRETSGVALMEASAPVLVSHAAADSTTPTSGICFSPVLSRTGRFVLFSCQSSDVVDGEPGIGNLIQNDSLGDLNSGVGLNSNGQWGYCQGAELGTCGAVGIVVDEGGQQAVFNSGLR